jgi:hypothetical protein
MPGEIPSTPIKVDLPPPAADVEPAPESTVAAAPPDAAADADAGSTPAKKPAADAETAYMRELKRRDAKVTRRERENGDRHAAITAREEAAKAREAAQAEREARLAERERLIDEDPIGYAEKFRGIPEEDIARRILNGRKPSQQELERRAKAERDGETSALKAQIAELQKMIDEAVIAPRRAEAQQRSAADARAAFTKHASDATKYPALARAIAAGADETLDLGDAIAAQVIADVNAGRAPAIAGTREQQIAELHRRVAERMNARLAKISGGPSAAAAPSGDTKGTEKPGQQGQEADPKVAPTLSGKGASQRAAIPKSDDIVLLEQEDPEAARKQAISAARKAKTAA